jgi:hypothetical protein
MTDAVRIRNGSVEREAMQWLRPDGAGDAAAVLDWMNGGSRERGHMPPGTWQKQKRRNDTFVFHLVIETLEGEVEVLPGDWIVKGVGGAFYPVKPEIFNRTYEVIA